MKKEYIYVVILEEEYGDTYEPSIETTVLKAFGSKATALAFAENQKSTLEKNEDFVSISVERIEMISSFIPNVDEDEDEYPIVI